MDQLSPGEALARLKQLIRTGKYGQNYSFKPTEKNNQLLEQFHFDN